MNAGEPARAAGAADDRGLRGPLLALAVLAFAALVVKCAWLCDDAYITFRTVEQLTAGEGPRWNPDERVQAYTHPLWMLVVSGARVLSGELYGTVLAVSALVSVAAFYLLVRTAALSRAGALAAGLALLGSKAFVDYSTSGLEGPLVHLLIVLIALAAVGEGRNPRRGLFVGCAASLLFVTRPDALPLVAPLVAAVAWEERRRPLWLLAGALPLVAWLAFSVAYYGFPFPNTAYAKLSSGLPRQWLLDQGLHYLASSARLDPLTPVAVAAALGFALLRRERLALLLATGCGLQLAYVVWVGGDFMSGRFLTPALFAAAIVIARCARRSAAAGWALAFGLLALAAPRSPLRAPVAYGALLDGSAPHDHIDARGVTDERAYWYHYTGLFSPARDDPARPHVTRGHPFAERLAAEVGAGPAVRVVNGMGFVGYFAGPVPHLVDPMGLTDPLLARLPVYRDGAFLVEQDVPAGSELPWRVGHFVRPLPEGYLETLESGDSAFASPPLDAYWRDLALATRAPVFAPGRAAAILRLNTGRGRELIRRYLDERAGSAASEGTRGDS